VRYHRLVYIFLFITIIGAPIPYLLHTESGLILLFNVVNRVAPGELSVDNLHGSLSNEITFNRIQYKDSAYNIVLNNGQVIWQPQKILNGFLRIDNLVVNGVEINIFSTDKQPNTTLPQIELPLTLSLANVELSNIQVKKDNLEINNISSLKLSATTFQDYIVIPTLVAETTDYYINLQGRVLPQDKYPMEATVRLKIKSLFFQPLIIDSTFEGDLQRLQTDTKIEGFVDGELSGYLFDIISSLNWKVDANIKKLSLQSFDKSLPNNNIFGAFKSKGDFNKISLIGQAFSSYVELGELSTEYNLDLIDEALNVNELIFKEGNSRSSLVGRGTIDWSSKDVVYNLATQWQHLVWPWKESSKIKSEDGEATFKGTVSDYDLNVRAAITSKSFDIPTVNIVANAHGNPQQLKIDQLKLQTLEGRATGSALIDWTDSLSWKTKLDILNINPNALFQGWPGSVNGLFQSSGKYKDSSYAANVSLTNIHGSLKKKELIGEIVFGVIDNDIDLKVVELNLGKSNVALHGKISDQFDLNYAFNSSDLSIFKPLLGGKLQSAGIIQGDRDSPRLNLQLNGEKLFYDEYALDSINSDINLSLQANEISNLVFNLHGLKAKDQVVDRASLILGGTIDKHDIELTLQHCKNNANWKFSGKFLEKQWQGSMTSSKLQLEHIGDWELTEDSDIHLASDKITINKSCYLQNISNVCFDANYNSEQFTANIDWQKVSIDLFNAWIPTQLKINTQFDGNAQLINQDENMTAFVEVRNTAGDVSSILEGKEHIFPFESGVTRVDWDSNQLIFNMLVPLINDSKIETNLMINQSDKQLPLLEQPISGNLNFQTESLMVLAPYAPAIKNLEQAKAKAQLNISGSMSDPIIEGPIEAQARVLEIPAFNIELEGVTVEIDSKFPNTTRFSSHAESGKGSIDLSGEVRLNKDNTLHGHSMINGKNFTALDIPLATIEVNPKLILQLEKENLSIEGDVLVPYARLRPQKLPVGTVDRSKDVIIVGDEKRSKASSSQWDVNSKIRIILGNRVNIDGFGLKSKLEGSLQLVDQPNSITLGRGEINLVDGTYRTFGHDLQIKKGRLVFANTPIDDPGLDISAQRNIDDITAGVRVTSTLRKPEAKLFSDPIMAESDVLSYLLLGRPLRQAEQGEGSELMNAATAMGLASSEMLARNIGDQLGIDEIAIETNTDTGASSLVIGQYLSPKLYIRYLTGIFERSNILQLRYDASKKIIIQTETGSQMGADIFYKIEH